MAWPNPPYPFGNATSPEAMSLLDVMFNQVGAMIAIPCAASGTNAISLSPLTNCPALTSYNELGSYRAVATNNSTGPVTLQYNGLGFLPVYHGDGITQANIADIQLGAQYLFTFHQALNGGAGGFFFLSASQPVANALWNQPGGRLTPTSAVPVPFSNAAAAQTIYYAPYQHPFVPVYNGAFVQMYQFTSSLSDQIGPRLAMGGSAVWPNGALFDVYMIFNGGALNLATVQWTNLTTRAVTLAVFGGFLTNSGAVTMQTAAGPPGANTPVVVPANQGTFLGTFFTSANGQTIWQFPGLGTAGFFGISNYYNPVLFTGFVQDNGAPYTYTSATVRQARASANNEIILVQASSERAILAQLLTYNSPVSLAGAQMTTGIGVNSITGSAVVAITHNFLASALTAQPALSSITFSNTGVTTLSSNEAGDGSNANTFDAIGFNQLYFEAWL